MQLGPAMNVSNWAWGLFALIVVAALAIDLGLLRTSRGEDRELTLRSASIRSAIWIALALLFGLVVMALYGPPAALTYITAYLLEESLSVDNIFVFLLIFSELRIPPVQQRRVLLWGGPECADHARTTDWRGITRDKSLQLGGISVRGANALRSRQAAVGPPERARNRGRRLFDMLDVGRAPDSNHAPVSR